MRESLKIGLFSRHFPNHSGADGIATYTASLATALGELGHEVHILTTGAPCTAKPAGKNVFLHSFAAGGMSALGLAWRASRAARKLARRYKLDIFEFPNWEAPGAFFHFGGRPCAMAVRVHTSYRKVLEIAHAGSDWRGDLRCRLEEYSCRAADGLCASTFAHRQQAAKELNIAEATMAVLPLGVPDTDNPRLKKPRSRMQPPTILFVGRLERRKGTLDLLHALPEVLKKVPNARLIMAGEDLAEAPGRITHQSYFERTFPENLRLNVKFIGVQSNEQLEYLYEHTSLLANPSVYESFGLVYVEAMRAALPAIGTLSGGIPEVIDHYNTGLVIRPRDPKGVAQAVITMLTNENLRLRLAATARERYEQQYTARVMALRVADHYRGIIALKQRAAEMAIGTRELLDPQNGSAANHV